MGCRASRTILDWGKRGVDDTVFKVYCISKMVEE